MLLERMKMDEEGDINAKKPRESGYNGVALSRQGDNKLIITVLNEGSKLAMRVHL